MQRKNTLILFFLLSCFAPFILNAQDVTTETKPTYEGTISSVEYVESIASRPYDLIPADQTFKEAKDKRSLATKMVIGEDPQKTDDYLYLNQHEQEQSMPLPPPGVVFDTYTSGSQPTDPSLAIGPNHVFVVFNTGFAIYDKSGTQLVAPTAPNPAIFPSGGCCDLTVSYDNAADRWVLSFLTGAGGGAQIAVSDGGDPVNAGWYIYNVSAINDYQKLSIWRDGYYMTENTSQTNNVWALERDKMLAGDSNAKILGFALPGLSRSGFYSPQAFNITDDNIPTSGGAPIVYMQDDAWGGVSNDHLKLWEVNVDWNNTGNSSVSSPVELPLTPFIGVFDNGGFSNLPQPNGGATIDALQATIMNQAQFRKFANHNSAVFNFVVDVDASNGKRAGIRWMELRQNGDGQPWSLYQEGTYTAPDNRHAWNASLAMDGQGNIGMGYTSMSGPGSSSTVRVSSYYTGRSNGDPLGVMTGDEGLIANGNANIPGTRYGDYSKMDVDPSDDETFWFITEYMNTSRKGVVGSFKVETNSTPDTEAPTTPTNLAATNISNNSATLTWNASTDNIGVTQYTISIDGNVVGTSATTSFNVTGLSASTSYNASVSAQDAAGNSSGNASTSFTTLATPPPTYCTSKGNNQNDEYISRVQLGSINNATGASPYSDFTSISTDLTEGQSYTITVTPTWTGTQYDEGYAVWIDYNSDGDFTDSGELVWSKAPSKDSPNTGTFTVPTGTAQSATRIRVSMKYNGIPTPCETFGYGEVEDYTINLLEGAGPDTEAPSTPSNLTASNITQTTATLSWGASSDNVGVTQYNVSVNGNVVGTTGTTSYNLSGLTASTSYTASVTAQDAAGNISSAASTSFTTLDNAANYCSSKGNSQSDEYISRVQLGSINNATGASPYSDFTAISTDLTEGESYTVTVTPTWTGTQYNEGYAVWIDYNMDGDFTDSGELVWSKAPSKNSPNSGTFTVPTGTSQTATRMRVSMKYNGIPTPCETFSYGEVEDYTVNLGAAIPDNEAPSTPSSLTASNITQTTATLSWGASSDNVGVTQYNVSVNGNAVGTTGSTSYNLSGLTASTSYTASVTAQDAAGNISGTASTSFTTLANQVTYCNSKGNNVSDEYIGRVQLNTINNASGAQGYTDFTSVSTSLTQAQAYTITVTPTWTGTIYREGYAVWIDYNQDGDFTDSGELVWSKAPNKNTPNSGSFTVPATALQGATRMRVSMKYNGVPSPCETFNYGEVEDYTVIIANDADNSDIASKGKETSGDQLKEFTKISNKNIKIHPNPTNSILNINVLAGEFDQVSIFSSTGKVMYASSEDIKNIQLDVTDYAPGMYFVRFVSNGLAVTKRFVKK